MELVFLILLFAAYSFYELMTLFHIQELITTKYFFSNIIYSVTTIYSA